MDKTTYLAALERELDALSATDRQNALAYYHEFLEDAEAAGETDANTVLGSPHTLAAQIKADIAMSDLEGTTSRTHREAADAPSMPDVPNTPGATDTPGASNVSGAPDASDSPATQDAPSTSSTPDAVGAPNTSATPAWTAAAATAPRIPLGAPYGTPYGAPYGTAYGAPGTPGAPPYGAANNAPPRSTTHKSDISVVWTVILAILAIPVGIPLAITIAALIFSVLVTLVSLLFSFAVVVVALLAAGIFSAIAGFFLLFSNFAVGLFYLGAGLLLLGLCILVGMVLWRLGKLCVKGVAKLFNAIRKKLTKKERGAQ